MASARSAVFCRRFSWDSSNAAFDFWVCSNKAATVVMKRLGSSPCACSKSRCRYACFTAAGRLSAPCSGRKETSRAGRGRRPSVGRNVSAFSLKGEPGPHADYPVSHETWCRAAPSRSFLQVQSVVRCSWVWLLNLQQAPQRIRATRAHFSTGNGSGCHRSSRHRAQRHTLPGR